MRVLDYRQHTERSFNFVHYALTLEWCLVLYGLIGFQGGVRWSRSDQLGLPA